MSNAGISAMVTLVTPMPDNDGIGFHNAACAAIFWEVMSNLLYRQHTFLNFDDGAAELPFQTA